MSHPVKQLNHCRLYYSPACLFCIRVWLFLRQAHIEIPSSNILTHPRDLAELIAGGGKRQVPCLRIEQEDGKIHWLYESGDIIHYLKNTAE